MNLITASYGVPHVTEVQDAALNRAMQGKPSGVYMNVAPLAEAANPSIPTEITIHELTGLIQGRKFNIDPNQIDTVTLDVGAQGLNRIDIIAVEVTVDAAQQTQSGAWTVIKGTPTEGTPTAPQYTEGDLDNGSLVARYGVFAITFTGSAITKIELIANQLGAIDEENMLLVWENTSPSTAFGAKTINNLDFKGRKFIKVFFKGATNESHCWVQDAVIGEAGGSMVTKTWAKGTASRQKFGIVTRQFNATQDSVVFQNPEEIHWNGNTDKTVEYNTTTNTHLIPWRIYAFD